MSIIDLSWLWEALSGVTATIQAFFSGIWTQVQNITNTGQGIFSGLVAFGTQLWDGIVKAFTVLGEWISSAFTWIYNGLKYIADIFGAWFSQAVGWLGSGIAWIGNQLYNFGNWLWNGAQYIIQYVWAGIQGVWTAVVNFFTGIANAFYAWWGTVTTSLNNWWTTVVTGLRAKIKQSIIASITITMSWKAGQKAIEKMMDFENPEKALLGIGGSLFGVVGSVAVGYLVAEVIDAVIPTTSTTPLQIVPTIGTPSIPYVGIEISPPTIPTPPYAPPAGTQPPTPPGMGYGFPLDFGLYLKSTLNYDLTTSSKDGSIDPSLDYTHDETLDSSDATLDPSIDLAYETVVT